MPSVSDFTPVSATVAIINAILLCVMCCVCVGQFGDIYFDNVFSINNTLFMGFGIAYAVIQGIYIIMMFAYIENTFLILLSVPFFFIYPIMFLLLYSPKNVENIIRKIGEAWSPSENTFFTQISQNCCGWSNSTDRALQICPFDASSGCISYFQNTISAIFQPLYQTGIATVVLSSFVVLSGLVISVDSS